MATNAISANITSTRIAMIHHDIVLLFTDGFDAIKIHRQ